MPALPAVPGVIRFQLQHSLGADVNVLSRFYVSYTGSAPTSTGLNASCSGVVSSWSNNLKALFSSGQNLLGALATDLSSASGAVGSNFATTAGSRAGAQLPAGVACLLNLHVNRRYRGGKPRIYLPFGVDADLNSVQTWTGTFTAAVTAAWNAFIASVLTTNPVGTTYVQQVNVSYYAGFHTFTTPSGRVRNIPTLRVTPVVDAIASVSTNGKFASQRRRNLH